ncbi:hypothetical protein CDAR_3411 [Caerostris darwini]|uniref:Uncharacterized protein n=1 Tax=Caerostris darwini TaxID=1538125 RepID=A0AAV4QUM3_9ARAC|nr:hypothetical protein CDAR_3411 [Caerostris darwini]
MSSRYRKALFMTTSQWTFVGMHFKYVPGEEWIGVSVPKMGSSSLGWEEDLSIYTTLNDEMIPACDFAKPTLNGPEYVKIKTTRRLKVNRLLMTKQFMRGTFGGTETAVKLTP